jgi:hypothetical protein
VIKSKIISVSRYYCWARIQRFSEEEKGGRKIQKMVIRRDLKITIILFL